MSIVEADRAGLSDDARYELAEAAAASERRNRPRFWLVLAAAALLAAGVVLISSLVSLAAANADDILAEHMPPIRSRDGPFQEMAQHVLFDEGIVTPGQGGDTGNVSNLSSVMDGNDCSNVFAARPGRFDLPGGIRDIEVKVRLPAIHQQRRGVEITDHFRRGGKRHRRHDHRLAGFQPDRFQCQVQRGGAAGPRAPRRRIRPARRRPRRSSSPSLPCRPW